MATLDELDDRYKDFAATPVWLGDEWEAVDDTPEFTYPHDPAGHGTAQYDIAYGLEVVSIGMGVCPRCGEMMETNVPMNLHSKDGTIYYDCINDPNHRYLIMPKDQE